MRIAESLMDYRPGEKEESSNSGGHKEDHANGGGDLSRRDKASWHDKGKGKKDDRHESSRPGLSCFICDGPHLKRKALSAMLAMEQGAGEDVARIGSLRILDESQRAQGCPREEELPISVTLGECDEVRDIAAIKVVEGATKQSKPRGRLLVDMEIQGKSAQAIIDLGAEATCMSREMAKRIGLPYEKARGYLKGINSEKLPIWGKANGAELRVGRWKGNADIFIAPMGKKEFYLGIDFFHTTKAVVVPHSDTMIFMVKEEPVVVPLKRENHGDKQVKTFKCAAFKVEDPPKGKRDGACKHRSSLAAYGKGSCPSSPINLHANGERCEGSNKKQPKDKRKRRKKRRQGDERKRCEDQLVATRALPNWVGENVTDFSRIMWNMREKSAMV